MSHVTSISGVVNSRGVTRACRSDQVYQRPTRRMIEATLDAASIQHGGVLHLLSRCTVPQIGQDERATSPGTTACKHFKYGYM